MDLFWIRKGGQDPLAYFKRVAGAVPAGACEGHDAGRDRWWTWGTGSIDWKAIYAARKEAGIKHWFVEHDEPADPMAR